MRIVWLTLLSRDVRSNPGIRTLRLSWCIAPSRVIMQSRITYFPRCVHLPSPKRWLSVTRTRLMCSGDLIKQKVVNPARKNEMFSSSFIVFIKDSGSRWKRLPSWKERMEFCGDILILYKVYLLHTWWGMMIKWDAQPEEIVFWIHVPSRNLFSDGVLHLWMSYWIVCWWMRLSRDF